MPDYPMIRLMVADLDGTLLNSAHQITPMTEDAVRQAMARGVMFTVATGKTYPSTTELIDRLGITLPVICSNGVLVHAPDGTILKRHPIPRDYALEAMRLADAAGLVTVIYSGANLICREYDHNLAELVEHGEPEPVLIQDLHGAVRADIEPDKIIFMNGHDLEGVIRFQALLEERFAGRAQAMRSGLDSLVELMPLGVSKGTALDTILDVAGVTTDETMCLGDNCNDLAMLRRAGIGVAMANAPDDVRAGASYVARSNDDDGVGHAIHKFVLNNAHEARRTG
jgi:Cof subfamily protein (haloacid dehalogenase superfamily)